MRRQRGYWWSPDGSTIAATRVDSAPISAAWIADPAQPTTPPRRAAYPFAGTDYAEVSLHLTVSTATSSTSTGTAGPYLTEVHWSAAGMIISTQSRSQQSLEILDVDVATGATMSACRRRRSRVDSSPARLRSCGPEVELVNCADREGARRLLIDGEPVTPADLQVRSVVAVDQGGVVFIANPIDDATVSHVWRYGENGLAALTDEPGVIRPPPPAARSSSARPRSTSPRVLGHPRRHRVGVVGGDTEPRPQRLGALLRVAPIGDDGAAAERPRRYTAARAARPIRGPARPAVGAGLPAHLVSQWFADHGFAVVVVDGRGHRGGAASGSGRSMAISPRRPWRTRSTPSSRPPPSSAVSTSIVAIRGWSFGGYLAALAVLLRPDRAHAAVAGAPVTEWRLYDTHYTERYLGDPTAQPRGVRRFVAAADRRRPLPTAAADPRARRRQRPRRPHAGTVVPASSAPDGPTKCCRWSASRT